MKISRPNIKIGSAGIGFILCLVVFGALIIFALLSSETTRLERESITPTFEVAIDGVPQTAKVKETEETIDKADTAVENIEDIEKDLPPITDQVTIDEQKPLFDDEQDNVVEEIVDFNKDVEIEDTSVSAENVVPGSSEATAPQSDVMVKETIPVEENIRPFKQSDERPRIGLIISDMGLSESATRTAIESLPGEITLAFAPYADNLDQWVQKARAQNHEVILSIPMEPKSFPNDDPGPNALLTALPNNENIDRLDWALNRTKGYVGIMNFMGSRFTASQEKLAPVMQHLKDKGVVVIDSSSGSDSLIPTLARINGIPYTKSDRFIDNVAAYEEIDEQLTALEDIARRKGHAIGIGFPYPVTFERIEKWSKTLKNKGFTLAPISALASEDIGS